MKLHRERLVQKKLALIICFCMLVNCLSNSITINAIATKQKVTSQNFLWGRVTSTPTPTSPGDATEDTEQVEIKINHPGGNVMYRNQYQVKFNGTTSDLEDKNPSSKIILKLKKGKDNDIEVKPIHYRDTTYSVNPDNIYTKDPAAGNIKCYEITLDEGTEDKGYTCDPKFKFSGHEFKNPEERKLDLGSTNITNFQGSEADGIPSRIEDGNPYIDDVVAEGTEATEDTEGDNIIKYRIISENSEDNPIAEVNPATGKLKFYRSGKVVVEAVKQANKDYRETRATYSITMDKANDTQLSFLDSDKKYSSVFEQFKKFDLDPATLGKGKGQVTFSIEGDKNVIKYINVDKDSQSETTAVVNLDTAGEFTLVAKKESSPFYYGSEAKLPITITKLPAYDITFENPTPQVYTDKDKFLQEPNNIQKHGGPKLKYSIERATDDPNPKGCDAKINSDTGEVSINHFGKVKVTVKSDSRCYEQSTGSYTLNIKRVLQDQARFEKADDIFTINTTDTFTNAVVGLKNLDDKKDEVEYSFVNPETVGGIAEINSTTGTVTAHEGGKVTVQASIKENGKTEKKELTYNLNIEKTIQTDLGFEISDDPRFELVDGVYETTYAPSFKATTNLINNKSTGSIEYVSSNQDVVRVDAESGAFEIIKAGEADITVTVKGDKTYLDTPLTIHINVEKAEQTGFGFEQTGTIRYHMAVGDTYKNIASGGQSSKNVEYKIIKGGAASIDEKTGVLTANYEGQVMVMATRPEDDCYKKAEATYSLIIESPKMTITTSKTDSAVKGIAFYKQTNKITIEITDKNLNCSKITGSAIVTELGGKEIQTKDYIKYLQNPDNWNLNGATERNTITFEVSQNGIYSFNIKYDSASENLQFAIDNQKPTDLTVTYTNPNNQKTINGINYSYYNKPITVTLSAKDTVAGIASFQYSCRKEDDISEVNQQLLNQKVEEANITYSKDGQTASIQFTVPSDMIKELTQFRGSIEFTATDRMDYHTSYKDDKKRIVVDTMSPTKSVSMEPIKIYDKETLQEKTDIDKDSYLLFNKNAEIVFTITEANFYSSDFKVMISKDGQAVEETKINKWKKDGDTYTGTLTLSAEGMYDITATYSDRSGNHMPTYRSGTVIVDKTAPKIQVDYKNKKAITKEDKRSYYNASQTATIRITDANFRAQDVEAKVTAQEISGKNIGTQDYTAYLKNASHWKTQGNVHTATVTYNKDANYTFDIAYSDMATNESKEYKTDEFTVDTTEPTNLTVSIDGNDVKSSEAGINYYNRPVKVTISATDAISGIDNFIYSCKKSDGVSAVNKEIIDQEIANAQIKYSQDRTQATATFTIPQSALSQMNQFRGTVEFAAVDKSENRTDISDDKQMVVDSIAPKAEVTYNDPYQTGADGVAYYPGDIHATIKITEANFNAEDATVSIVKNTDGKKAISGLKWTQNADTWTTTVDLSEAASYQLYVSYQDRSKNEPVDYTSPTMIIDKTSPVVTLQGVKSKNAYDQEKVGFTITVSDDNIDGAAFDPAFNATERQKDGSIVNKRISLGDRRTIQEGKSYSYSIDNLQDDGYYTVVCEVKDRAGNVSKQILSSDEPDANGTATPMDQMEFSVNRNGSVYQIEDQTKKITEQYYVQKVEDDIILDEINVDELNQYVVQLNGKDLVKDEDYSVQTNADGGAWYRYQYRVNSALFKDEGNYSIVIRSEDKTGKTAYNDLKQAEVAFTVDRTQPQAIVSGAKSNGRYQVNDQKVTIIPKDDGGKIQHVKVVITDKNGDTVDTPIDQKGMELWDELEKTNETLTCKIPTGVSQNVSIVCTDVAGNQTIDNYNNITVSDDWFIIFWANDFLRNLVLFGGLGLIGAIVILITVLQKRKKDLQEAANNGR